MYETIKERFLAYTNALPLTQEQREVANTIKLDHTLRVVELSDVLARSVFGDDPARIGLAKVIGLLHDIGRWEQVLSAGAFSDTQSDHGAMGANAVIRTGMIHDLSESDQALILTAIREHNKKYSASHDPETQAFVDIVRDADKVDGFYVNVKNYSLSSDEWKRVLPMFLPFSHEMRLSDGLYDAIMEERLADSAERQTVIDFRFFIMAWVYDMKLEKSMEILREKGYLHTLYNDIPNPDERMTRAYRKICDFITPEYLFTREIADWDAWGKVFQSAEAFTPLAAHIFEKENLPFAPLENTTPGTNAVFKSGEYVIKIFAPHASEGATLRETFGTNVDVEMFGMRWAEAQGVPAPRLIAHGEVKDKYNFKYMVMDYIKGELFNDVEKRLTYDEKVIIGQKVRAITDKLNQPCENFNKIDMMEYAFADPSWEDEGFPASFQAERMAYLRDFDTDAYKHPRASDAAAYEKVYCHADFHGENILVDENLDVYLVDFADAMYAPAQYEQVYVVSALFCFEKPYMRGYFGEYNTEEIVDLCMVWLPIHVWGHSTITGHFKPVSEITSFEVLREKLRALIEKS
ncbi:MAG: phosphotransferase [Defluviitaleaceae bacterium]|nr:phosphotransferase [Defluviitaleaceae bacterium]